MKNKKILEHVIDIFTEQLFIAKINLKFLENRAKEIGDKNSFDYDAAKAKALQEIDGRIRQLDIAQEMLKEYEK